MVGQFPHYVIRKGKYGYWMPTPAMRAMGFDTVPCGLDGPEARCIAAEWEERYQKARRGDDSPDTPTIIKRYPTGSIGFAFAAYRHTKVWAAKKPRTREDWERGWKYIEPYFADVAPNSITMEILDVWYDGLLRSAGVGEAYRAMKIWRALYNVMASMRLCPAGQDPSLSIRRAAPAPRFEVWTEGEVVRLVKTAWRSGYCGLACIIAVAWDTSFSPVDARLITTSNLMRSGDGWAFFIERAKTGESAVGTLSKRTLALVRAYISNAPTDSAEPIFKTRGSGTTLVGGRPQPQCTYSKDTLVKDFASVRSLVFGAGESRKLMDMRRSGAVEAIVGGASAEMTAAKLSNSLDTNKALYRTYIPVDQSAVIAADHHRRLGRSIQRSARASITSKELSGV